MWKVWVLLMERDFVGNTLNIGDEVIFVKQMYREFATGKVLRMTKHQVVLSTEKDGGEWK